MTQNPGDATVFNSHFQCEPSSAGCFPLPSFLQWFLIYVSCWDRPKLYMSLTSFHQIFLGHPITFWTFPLLPSSYNENCKT